jgi:hypothetical protein
MVYQSTEDFVTEMAHFLATDYTILSGAVIWFYDILLTLNDEASLLWTRGGRFIKALYLTASILSPTAILAYLLTYSQCRIGIYPSWAYPWSSRVSELVLDQLWGPIILLKLPNHSLDNNPLRQVPISGRVSIYTQEGRMNFLIS